MTQIRKEAAEKEPPFIRRSTALWITTAVGLASAVVFAVVSASIVLAIDRPNRASLGECISDFAKSPGLAGLCAIAAAVLAFWGIHRQVAVSRKGLAHQREVEMKRAWWERFEWAASRAVPASKDGIPLPYDVILNTLTSLLDTATDEVQRVTIRAVAEEAAKRQGDFGKHKGLSGGHSPSEISRLLQEEDRMQQALRNYARSAGSTSARSGIVDASLYEHQVVEALKRLLSPRNVQYGQGILSQLGVGASDRIVLRGADAMVNYMGKSIVIHVEYSRNKGEINSGRARNAVEQVLSLIEEVGADAGLIVSPRGLRAGALDQENSNILAVAWESPEDDNTLKSALDCLADNFQ